MADTTIPIGSDVRDNLRGRKRGNETYSEVIHRLLNGSNELEQYELDDTDERLSGVKESIETALRDTHNIPEDRSVYIYEVDADVTDERFRVGVHLE